MSAIGAPVLGRTWTPITAQSVVRSSVPFSGKEVGAGTACSTSASPALLVPVPCPTSARSI